VIEKFRASPLNFATVLAIFFSLVLTNSMFASLVYPQELHESNRVQKFHSNGTFIAKWGTPGINSTQFNNPTGIAVDATGNVYVTDTDNNRVQKFHSNGTFIAKYGTAGTNNTQFNNPIDIAVDAAGNVYVID
jgi:DNA-binding beta-propeller fold protein YncE